MRLALRIAAVLLFLGSSTSLLALQRIQFQRFGQDYSNSESEVNQRAEFGWSRLRYDGNRGGYGYGGFGGFRGGSWSQDYPKADRQFLIALRRLTRINAKPIEQVVDLDSDEIYNWPFVYAVQVESWTFTDAQAKRLREYLLKGGFLMVDDFHGTADWEAFMRGMRMVFPDRPVEDLQNSDELFQNPYDLSVRFQVPGEQYVGSGRTYEKDGFVPIWRDIRDDKGRIMVAICANMHLGDAWEWADDPRYPERFASLAFKLGINYIMYSMTH
jgi:hypothetical protein